MTNRCAMFSRRALVCLCALATCLCLLLLCAACDGSQIASNTPSPGSDGTLKPAADPTAGINPELWAQLTAELDRVLAEEGTARRASAVPTGPASVVKDLSIHYVAMQNHHTWSYRNQGDYDLNGEVNIGDLTQVGIHFGKNTLSADWQQAQLADGDVNGEITIADVTPIGQNFQGRLDGYELQERDNPGEAWSVIQDFPFVAGTPATGLYPEYDHTGPLMMGPHEFQVVPYVDNGGGREYGPPSNLYSSLSDGLTNWSMHRGGMLRDGQSRTTGPTSAAEVWELTLEGTPIVQEPIVDHRGDIFLGTLTNFEPPLDGPGYFHSISQEGELNWRLKTAGGITVSAATSYCGHIAVGDSTGLVYSFTPDGKQLWRTQLPGLILFNSPLMSSDGVVYIVSQSMTGDDITGSTLFKIMPDGQIDWSRPLNDVCYSAPFYNAEFQVTVVDKHGELYSWDLAGNSTYNFTMPNEMSDTSSMTGSVAYRGAGLVYSTVNDSMHVNAYNDIFTINVPLGETPQTSVSINSVPNFVVGTRTAAPDPELRLNVYNGGVEDWDMVVSGVFMSNIAVDSADRMYFLTFNSSGTELVDSGIFCVLPDQTIAWYYPLDDQVSFSTVVADTDLLLCAVFADFRGDKTSTLIGIRGS